MARQHALSKDSVVVTAGQHQEIIEGLHPLSRRQHTAQRCQIVLLDEEGWSNRKIAWKLCLNRQACRLGDSGLFNQEEAGALQDVARGSRREPQNGLQSQKSAYGTVCMLDLQSDLELLPGTRIEAKTLI